MHSVISDYVFSIRHNVIKRCPQIFLCVTWCGSGLEVMIIGGKFRIMWQIYHN